MRRLGFLFLSFVAIVPAAVSQTPVSTPVASASSSPATITAAPVVAGRANLETPIDKVWEALPAAYASLSIPITVSEPANRLMGTQRMRTHHYLGDLRMSKLLSCGETAGILNADSWDVNLSMLTALQPNSSGGTTVTTVVDAAAKPSSVAGQYTSCESTGELETRLVRSIESQLR